MAANPQGTGWLRRHRRWLIVVAALLVFRITLPSIVRWVAEWQAAKNLNGEVSIGDVDLALLQGGIELKDVVVRARSAPGAQPLPPLISWKRFAVGVHWLPLFRKTVQLREVVLESPRIAMERLKSGDLNLLTLIPQSEAPAPTPAPTPAEAAAASTSTWQFGADRIQLKNGVLGFADLMLDQAEPIEVSIDSIEVAQIALAPGVYGEPSNIQVDLKVDDSVIRVGARFAMRNPGMFLDTTLTADRFPLRRTRLYIPRVGWSDLKGELSADVAYHLESGVRDEAMGKISLHNLTVNAPDVEEAALAWRSLDVEIESVDLLARKATVPSVHLDGAVILVRTSGGQVLPVLATANQGTAAEPPPTPAEPTPATEPAATATAPTPPSPPWQWLVRLVDVTDASVRIISQPPMAIGVAAQAHDLSNDLTANIPIQLKLQVGDGSLALEGEARPQPVGLRGRLQLKALDLPPLLAAAAIDAKMLDSAKLTTDLTLGIGSLAPEPGAIQVDGTLALANLQVHPSSDSLAVVAESLDVSLAPLLLRGALPASGARTGDLSLHGAISITAPKVEGIPGSKLAVGAKSVQFDIDQVDLQRLLADVAAEAAAPADAHLRATLRIQNPNVTTADGKGGSISLDLIELGLKDVSARGFRPVASDGGMVRVQGRLSLAKLQVSGPDPKLFSLGAKTIDLPFDDIQAAGFLGGSPAKRRVDVRLGDIRIDQPVVRVTRGKDGIAVPAFGGAPPAANPAPAVAAPAGNPAPPLETAVAVASFRLGRGKVGFSDRAVTPFFTTDIDPLDVEVRNLTYPNLAMKSARVDASIAPDGEVHASGSLGPDGSRLELKTDNLALDAFNPYATAYSPYSIAAGSLTLDAKAATQPGGYKLDSSITLHEFDLGGSGGESAFESQFGVPLSVGLALLRDMNDNIELDIPVESDEQGMKVGLATIVSGALRSALVNALASPLKLAGAVFKEGKVQAVAPTTVAFRPGRDEPTSEGAERLKQLAALLSSRPGMGVTLNSAPTIIDARWLREQALRAKLDNPDGVAERMRSLFRRGTRDTILAALEARANDEPGDLDAETTQTLDEWLQDIPEPSGGALQALAQSRLDWVRARLQQDSGVAQERMATTPAAATTLEESPQVHLKLSPVRALQQAERSDNTPATP